MELHIGTVIINKIFISWQREKEVHMLLSTSKNGVWLYPNVLQQKGDTIRKLFATESQSQILDYSFIDVAPGGVLYRATKDSIEKYSIENFISSSNSGHVTKVKYEGEKVVRNYFKPLMAPSL